MIIVVALLGLLFAGTLASRVFDVVWTVAENFLIISAIVGVVLLIVFWVRRRKAR